MMREKKIKGIKRHFLVDVMGLLICIVVHVAHIQERAGAKLVLQKAANKREKTFMHPEGGTRVNPRLRYYQNCVAWLAVLGA